MSVCGSEFAKEASLEENFESVEKFQLRASSKHSALLSTSQKVSMSKLNVSSQPFDFALHTLNPFQSTIKSSKKQTNQLIVFSNLQSFKIPFTFWFPLLLLQIPVV